VWGRAAICAVPFEPEYDDTSEHYSQ